MKERYPGLYNELSKLGEVETEVKFHPTRRWRLDYALPQHRLAVEVEGGVYSGGRHTRGKGFEGDIEKYNQANALGWTVYRIAGHQAKTFTGILSLIDLLKQHISRLGPSTSL